MALILPRHAEPSSSTAHAWVSSLVGGKDTCILGTSPSTLGPRLQPRVTSTPRVRGKINLRLHESDRAPSLLIGDS